MRISMPQQSAKQTTVTMLGAALVALGTLSSYMAGVTLRASRRRR